MKSFSITLLSFLLVMSLFQVALAQTTFPEVTRGEGFATFDEIPVILPDSYDGYRLPVSKLKLKNLDRFEFSDSQMKSLIMNGFFVKPARWKEFFRLYDSVFYDDIPIFITTDSALHVYHLLFEKMLRELEKDHFSPDLIKLTMACRMEAEKLYGELSGTDLEGIAESVLAYFSVAEGLLMPGSAVPPAVSDMVKGELALIDAHSGIVYSVIFDDMKEDYSQYIPRGHYTRSETLKRYFRTMMWYGRINMRLKERDETKMALLITYILRNADANGTSAAELWDRIYEPTTFIVGKADDLTFVEYGALWDQVFGADAGPMVLADDEMVMAFIEAARKLPPPQVNSMWVYIWEDEEDVTQGFRFMGQRFVLDAYIFEQLIFRSVGTLENPRMLPVALDVMAALGSGEALKILEEMGETAYENYTTKMEKVRGEISSLGIDSWSQNLYWSWLYTLMPLLEPKGESYPAFMRNSAWTRKDIHTALGSWTELKHDTILYAKQVMAEMGNGGDEEPPPGWVEPQPMVYARLLALTRMTKEGLSSRGLLTGDIKGIFKNLDELLTFLLDVSMKELTGVPLTEIDYVRIMHYGGDLEWLTLEAADMEGEDEYARPYFEKIEAALIADVATDPNGRVLEEATGRIFEIYVVIPDGKGGLVVSCGGVYSYYEFPWPMSDRLTDEAWKDMLERDAQPDRPGWTDSFVVE